MLEIMKHTYMKTNYDSNHFNCQYLILTLTFRVLISTFNMCF